ncbi:MAG: LysM peptidoglycan-binding domain-containing protein [Nocardioides sp.]
MSTMTLSPTLTRSTTGSTTRPAPGAAGDVRLTRRGRGVVLVLALLVLLAAGWLLGGGRSAATEHPGAPTPTRVVMVGAGDTLWDIAAGLAGDGDVRAMVATIEELNALDSAFVDAGQRLRVPVLD